MNGLPYYYASAKQFWQARAVRRGFQIIKEGANVKAQYEKMIMMICSVLPIQYDVVLAMDYPQFFRTVKLATDEVERQKSMANKNKKK